MKPGEIFDVQFKDLVKPLTGHLVTVTLPDGESVKARITHIYESSAALTVVSDDTKE